ncbi:hypothetical protein [Sphingomonas sp. 22176]|uniref:hypothetical protein n=1 Tax=Sphingomonas sp. 22176 TaxID=3453884 RepID=UPI003F845BDD
MSEVSTIGLDVGKNVFHAHGADAGGPASFCRKLSRTRLLDSFVGQPRCVVAPKASGGAHHWARALREMGMMPVWSGQPT